MRSCSHESTASPHECLSISAFTAQAEEKETKVIDEDGLFALVAATSHLAGASQPAAAPAAAINAEVVPLAAPPAAALAAAAAAPLPARSAKASAAAGPSRAAGPSQSAAPLGGPKGQGADDCLSTEQHPSDCQWRRLAIQHLHHLFSTAQPLEHLRHVLAAGVRPSVPPQPPAPSTGDLWVEKHKPKHSKQLVGNVTLIGTLRQWLQNWCALSCLVMIQFYLHLTCLAWKHYQEILRVESLPAVETTLLQATVLLFMDLLNCKELGPCHMYALEMLQGGSEHKRRGRPSRRARTVLSEICVFHTCALVDATGRV